MSDKKYKYTENQKLPSIFFGVLFGVVVSLCFLFIFAAIYTVTDLEEYYNAVFATLSLVLGSFVGATYTVSRIKNKGFINGIIVGAVMYLLVFIVSLFVSNNSFSLSSLFHSVCCLLSGGIAGIIRVNREANKKYLK